MLYQLSYTRDGPKLVRAGRAINRIPPPEAGCLTARATPAWRAGPPG